MSKNYLTYPCATMKITQSYNGKTSHAPHNTGTPKDYPIDEAGKDGGRDWFYCPCDEVKIVRLYGVGNSGANTVWLESTGKVDFADGTSDFVTIMVTHPNDDDLKNIKIGQKFKRGEAIFREGTDGNASGNHLHMSAGKGKLGANNGWKKNNNGKWVLTTKNGTFKPEELFFLDNKFTTVLNDGGLKFKTLPTEEKKTTQTTTGKKPEAAKSYSDKIVAAYKTKAKLNLRLGAGTTKEIITTLPKDSVVHCYGYYTTVSNVKWYYVIYNGTNGYASSEYLKKV